MVKSCTAPAEHCSEENPQDAGQIAELRGERGSDKRTRAGDGGEMMAQQNPFVGGFIIAPVTQTFGGCGAAVIKCHHFCGDELGVETKADGVDAGGGDDQPQAVDRFATIAGNDAQSKRSADSDGGP